MVWEIPSSYPTLCFKEIRVSPKSGMLSSGTVSQALCLENFATTSQSCCSNSITSIYRGFVVQLVPTVVQQLTRFRLTYASRVPSAVAKPLVEYSNGLISVPLSLIFACALLTQYLSCVE